ncbi:retrovirus-related pol polyprotein from transposon TNT 1-94 [Tanacetum coccineum]
MEETVHVTFSEDDEAISQSNTEGDAINFNENRSFPDDEFFEPRSKDSVSPEEPPKFTSADDHPALNELDLFESDDILEPVEIQNTIINEPISDVQPSLTILPSAEGILQPLVPQDKWSREKHIELVNIICEPLAGITTRSRVRDLEAASAHECLYNGKISEEVYVQQPHGFESSEFPNYVCKLDKALYELKQPPKHDFKGISIYQEKYVKDLLKKYDLADSALVKCLMLPPNNLGPDESGVSVNETLFRGMIGSLMYLTASRPDIQFSTFLCARYQANPKESYLVAVKRIFRYLKGTPNLSLCYLKGSRFDLKAYSDSDYTGCNLDRKSTSRDCQILGGKLVFLWIKSQLADYDVLYDKVPIFCDNTSAIAISNNTILQSRTNHIDIISATKSITFTISHFDKPLSFNLDVFSTVIGLERSKNFVLIPPKETVKAGLATLGLTDENDTLLSSSDLINSSSLHPVTGKKERKLNICYTRYLSLILEHLLGEAYTNKNLKTLKSHHITALSFKTTLENETALTAHMYKVAELSPDPIKSLLPPSGEVNADDSGDKSSSRTSVQSVIQPKAPTDLNPKKKRIPPSFKPKSSKQVRNVPQKKQVAETQFAEETVDTADATQSLGASESAEDQVNQPRTADAEKVQEQNVEINVKSSGPTSHGDVTFKQLMDEYDKKQSAAIEESENPYDTEFEIKGAEHDDMDQRMEEPTDFDLHSLLIDESCASSGYGLMIKMKKPLLIIFLIRWLISTLPLTTDKLEEFVPDLVVESLKATLPALITKSLKLAILEIIAEFMTLQKELSKVLKTKMGSSIRMKVRKEHAPSVSEPAQTTTNLVIHTPKEKALEDMVLEEEPSPKRIKFLIPNPSTASPTPLSLILPQNMTMGQFIDSLFNTTSYEFSPTPPKDKSKGKGIAVEEEPLKPLLPLIEQSGSDPKMLNLDQFRISAEQEKIEKKLKTLSKEELEAQATKLAEYDAKRKRMLEEYNHYITSSQRSATKLIELKASPMILCSETSRPSLSRSRLSSEIIQEVFVKDNIIVDGMQRNLIPPPGVKERRRVPHDHYCLADQKSEHHSEGQLDRRQRLPTFEYVGIKSLLNAASITTAHIRVNATQLLTQAEEGPNYALMAYSSSSSDSEVSNDSNCSKSCMKTVKLLKSQNDQLLRDLEKSSLMVLGYKTVVENRKLMKKKEHTREKDEANVAVTEEWDEIQAKIEVDHKLASKHCKHRSKKSYLIKEKGKVYFNNFWEQKESTLLLKKIHKEGKNNYFEIIRADEISKMYLVFSQLLKSVDREDLVELYKLVKAKYGSTRPVEDMDFLLRGDLKTMFEPHVEDEIWKLQQRYKVLSWKLYDFAIWNDLHAGRKEISLYTTYNYRYAEQEASG